MTMNKLPSLCENKINYLLYENTLAYLNAKFSRAS